ncbi:hypothetical protein HYN24_12970 [Dechloromonas sp. HYN0024]|nr:hypothetical protein HYN24_12970 [Dechloromonas sp. HYN0024]
MCPRGYGYLLPRGCNHSRCSCCHLIFLNDSPQGINLALNGRQECLQNIKISVVVRFYVLRHKV